MIVLRRFSHGPFFSELETQKIVLKLFFFFFFFKENKNSRNLSESDRQMMAKYEKCDIQMSAIHWPGKRLHSSPVSSYF